MTSTIAVFNTHQKALNAAQILYDNHFNMKNISILGKAEEKDNHLHLQNYEDIEKAPVIIGTSAGTVIGLLTGISLFAIPGIGFLYGAGAIVGAIGGFEVGAIGGGIVSIFAGLGINKKHNAKLEEHLKKGKYILAVHGDQEELTKAKLIFKTKGKEISWEE